MMEPLLQFDGERRGGADPRPCGTRRSNEGSRGVRGNRNRWSIAVAHLKPGRLVLDENHSAHTEREESGQSEGAQREQPREPAERNALNLGGRRRARAGRWRMAGRRETARAFGRGRTTPTRAEIVERAHPSSRASRPKRHRCASTLRSSRIRSRGFFPAGKPPKALCPSPRSSRARMRSRAARSLRSVTQRSNSSSRIGMSPEKHEPCRARSRTEAAETTAGGTSYRRRRRR